MSDLVIFTFKAFSFTMRTSSFNKHTSIETYMTGLGALCLFQAFQDGDTTLHRGAVRGILSASRADERAKEK